MMKYGSISLILLWTLLLTAACAWGSTTVDRDDFTIEYEVQYQDRTVTRTFCEQGRQFYSHTVYTLYYIAGKVHNSRARNIATFTLDFTVQGRPQRVVVSNLGPQENKEFSHNLWEVQNGSYTTSNPSAGYSTEVYPPAVPTAALNSFTYVNRQGEATTVNM